MSPAKFEKVESRVIGPGAIAMTTQIECEGAKAAIGQYRW